MRHLAVLLILLGGCGSGTTFDAQKWRAANLDTRERAEMVDSLTKAHRLNGMTRAAVVDLLGEPAPTDKWDGCEMAYVLGPDGGLFPIDNDWLLIDLDQQGRVSAYRIESD